MDRKYEKMKDFFDCNFNISKVELVCFVEDGQGERLHPNRSSYGLAMHTGGEIIYTFNGQKDFTVRQNDIIFLPQNSNYVVNRILKGSCYAINFNIVDEISLNPFVIKVKDYGRIFNMFQSAERAFRQKNTDYEMMCKSELYSIICAMHREYNSSYISSKKKYIISPALEYIHSEYTNGNISIEYLSELCGVSPAYFRRIFLSCYGTSPIKYINNLKLERAKELLSSGLYSVRDVIELSGFNEPCYFNRFFKKETGITPKEFKEQS